MKVRPIGMSRKVISRTAAGSSMSTAVPVACPGRRGLPVAVGFPRLPVAAGFPRLSARGVEMVVIVRLL